MADSLTIEDRAGRARALWDAYRSAHGDALSSLFADLMHLADVDGHASGGVSIVRGAAAEYLAAHPEWVIDEPPLYRAQYLPAGQLKWVTVAEGDRTVEPQDVACCLWNRMKDAGMDTELMPDMAEDMVRGVTLLAENGTGFRLVTKPHQS
ncbi:hypothetical protein AB0G74_32450 [Streptomyces sp. NPDC020875]|uniref:hypothetical protein n=1 Tax=Streptomyces sp. NPDC020875 TaxID=3154898 RepID=UPI0033D1A04D